MKGQLIGGGNTAEVYNWGANEILKLFCKEFPMSAIEREYQASKIIGNQGLSVPKVSQMIELEGRSGIIYEKVVGVSLLNLIMKKPLTSKKYLKQLAELQYQMHQCKKLELPNYKELLEWNIRHTKHLSETQKLAVLNQLEQLPEGEALCHGDFHPGNIMVKDNKLYILDWMTASVGAPAADVARTIILLKDSALPENMPRVIKYIIQTLRKGFSKAYLKQYLKLSGLSKEDIDRWRTVLAAARLMEWIPEAEKKYLLNVIYKGINQKDRELKC